MKRWLKVVLAVVVVLLVGVAVAAVKILGPRAFLGPRARPLTGRRLSGPRRAWRGASTWLKALWIASIVIPRMTGPSTTPRYLTEKNCLEPSSRWWVCPGLWLPLISRPMLKPVRAVGRTMPWGVPSAKGLGTMAGPCSR